MCFHVPWSMWYMYLDSSPQKEQVMTDRLQSPEYTSLW